MPHAPKHGVCTYSLPCSVLPHLYLAAVRSPRCVKQSIKSAARRRTLCLNMIHLQPNPPSLHTHLYLRPTIEQEVSASVWTLPPPVYLYRWKTRARRLRWRDFSPLRCGGLISAESPSRPRSVSSSRQSRGGQRSQNISQWALNDDRNKYGGRGAPRGQLTIYLFIFSFNVRSFVCPYVFFFSSLHFSKSEILGFMLHVNVFFQYSFKEVSKHYNINAVSHKCFLKKQVNL